MLFIFKGWQTHPARYENYSHDGGVISKWENILSLDTKRFDVENFSSCYIFLADETKQQQLLASALFVQVYHLTLYSNLFAPCSHFSYRLVSRMSQKKRPSKETG